jgi:hypothetical protein
MLLSALGCGTFMASVTTETNMNTERNEKLAESFRFSGIAVKEVEQYGSQLVVTCFCEDSANRAAKAVRATGMWAVRRVMKALEDAKQNEGSFLCPSVVTVWRVYARLA